MWTTLLVLAALIIVDVLTAVGVALAKGKFELGKLFLFLRTNVLPYFIGYVALLLLVYAAKYVSFPEELTDWLQIAVGGVYVFILGKLVASIVGNLQAIGLPASTPDAYSTKRRR